MPGARFNATLLYLLAVAATTITAAPNPGLWDADTWAIFRGPAPSPEDGPPASRHASRNKALLPYQIGAIVGSYVITVAIIFTLLFTVGKRWRREAETSRQTLEMEIVKPAAGHNYDPSLLSPKSEKNWRARVMTKKGGEVRSPDTTGFAASPVSVASFDNKVIENDKVARQLEMEQLYAAVMAHDEAKRSQITVQEVNLPPTHVASPRPSAMSPRFATYQLPAQMQTSSPTSPVRAIYPPDTDMSRIQPSATSPIRARYQEDPAPLTPYGQHSFPREEVAPQSSPRTPRFFQKMRPGSSSSKKEPTSPTTSSPNSKPAKNKIRRNMRISAPILAKSGPIHPDDDDARTPLTPRFYDPGPPPSPPRGDVSPVTPAHYSPDFEVQPRTSADHFHYEGLDRVQPLPREAPHRHNPYNNSGSSLTLSNPAPAAGEALPKQSTSASTSTLTISAPPVKRTPSPNASSGANATNTTAALPFRQLPFREANHPTSSPLHSVTRAPKPISALSPTPTKTTFLEPRRSMLSAPRTGMATPYSPYMPFTPLTPVTVELVNKRERKRREKEEGRRRVKFKEVDEVLDENEVWGSPY